MEAQRAALKGSVGARRGQMEKSLRPTLGVPGAKLAPPHQEPVRNQQVHPGPLGVLGQPGHSKADEAAWMLSL